MSSVSPFGAISSDVSPALLPLAAQQSVSVSTTVSTSASGWTTGDYKVSMQAADHDDVGGGKWLICDASAIDASYAALIALCGANRPDARGRTLVMQGTNASVSTVLANDGQSVANRRPHHRTSLTDPGHAHAPLGGSTFRTGKVQYNVQLNTGSQNEGDDATTASATTGITVGSGNANDALDTPSFIVPGNLFIHT